MQKPDPHLHDGSYNSTIDSQRRSRGCRRLSAAHIGDHCSHLIRFGVQFRWQKAAGRKGVQFGLKLGANMAKPTGADAAELAQVDTLLCVGGAHAVAALALGTAAGLPPSQPFTFSRTPCTRR